MPFMSAKDAYLSRQKEMYNLQIKGRSHRQQGASSSMVFDYDVMSAYLHTSTPIALSTISQGVPKGSLYVIGSGTAGNKSHVWQKYKDSTLLDEFIMKSRDTKDTDISTVPNGDIDELLKLRTKTISTMNRTVKLWSMMLSVFDRSIEIDSVYPKELNRQQEYFQINGKRYSVRYTTQDIQIYLDSTESAWRADKVIALRYPRSSKPGGQYRVSRWAFTREAIMGSAIEVYNDSGNNCKLEHVSESDVEAYLFQESLVHDTMKVPFAMCLGSACENDMEYNFHSLNIDFSHLSATDDHDDFSLVLEAIIQEQRSRMQEYITWGSDKFIDVLKFYED